MKKFIKTAGLAVAFAAMAVTSASATVGPAMVRVDGTPGTGHNTGSLSGNASTYGASSFTAGGGAVKVQCGTADFKVTSTTTNTVNFDASYSPGGAAGPCTFAVSGTVLGTAAIDTTTSWSLLGHHAVFDTSTGATTDVTVTNSVTKVTVPGIGCTLDVFHQTSRGITIQNIDAAGNNTTVATPWGSKIIASVNNLTYTTTGSCVGLPEHGTDGFYSGTVAIANVFGSL